MKRRIAAGLLLASVLLSCLSEHSPGIVDNSACSAVMPPVAFGTTLVIVRNFTFTPANVRVRPGTSVTWVNCGTSGDPSHTATADDATWTSTLLAPGQTFTREFTTVGAFAYHCEPHPSMMATVTVE
jgi:plastocyanin